MALWGCVALTLTNVATHAADSGKLSTTSEGRKDDPDGWTGP